MTKPVSDLIKAVFRVLAFLGLYLLIVSPLGHLPFLILIGAILTSAGAVIGWMNEKIEKQEPFFLND